MDLYNTKGKAGVASQTVYINDTKPLLNEVIKMNDNVVIFLDALDECLPESKKDLLKIFKKLLKSCHNLKMVISSRDQSVISRRLENYPAITVTSIDNKDDIEGFVR
ncbi:hypothetical protein BO71DRAFT_312270 [Aspergillus ellipticus CBS 707.79]|uniref:Nephrocystin 3-like N-terminal domain-containing protein n=1 Tax=Aspergillus ellipticus CBS 707.79 TaxID=1448320 RepID=A0A319DRQ9_9EURO|nr:hypothetical protein BO71DRAFT_312270 [Aspergillus ellipticus CBS 707.79]